MVSDSKPTSVAVHPLVLLSVVDHYHRAARNTTKRVVGVLLGQSSQGKVNVASSFAVPFEEDDKDPNVWFVDHDYIELMADMFRKEKLVGWYHSGPSLRQADLHINELFKKYTTCPVLLIVSVNPTVLDIPTDAYYAVDEIHDDGTATTRTFNHISSSIEAEEAEEIGVEHLLRDIKDRSVGTLSTQITTQLSSLKGLFHHLTGIKSYLSKILNGTLPINHQILYNLQDMFNLLPNLNVPSIVASFSIKTNDELLVIYLSSLIRAVIALHNLIENKVVLRNHELEDLKDKGEGQAVGTSGSVKVSN